MQVPQEKIEVLIVDDRPENLLALESVLASPLYQLMRANSGDEALRYLLDHQPALILMDVQMPGLDGFETASIIKRSERTRAIPIVFITALNQDERYVAKGYEHGAIDYVYKPYDAAILKAKVGVFAELARKNKDLIRVERQLREVEKRDRERQLAQLELKSLRREQSIQKKYLDLVSGITHGIVWCADPHSQLVTFVSPSTETILGYVEEDWKNEPDFVLNHIPLTDRKLFLDAIQKVSDGKGPMKLEHRFVSRRGKEIWFQTEFSVGSNSDSQNLELRALSIDISAAKDAQELLRCSKNRADLVSEISLILGQSFDFSENLKRIGRTLTGTCADGVLIYEKTENGLIQILSESFAKGIKSPDIHTMEELGLDQVFEQGETVFWEEVPEKFLIRKNFRVNSAILTPVRNSDHVLYAVCWIRVQPGSGFIEDDRVMAEEMAHRGGIAWENAFLNQKAESAVRIRDEFLSVASHELKTPLTPLKLQAQMLSRILKNGGTDEIKIEKVDKVLHTFNRQIDRLSILIDELLDISKMTNGKLTLNLEDFDLNELIADILSRFSGLLETSKCELDCKLDEKIWVHWDRFRMEQVLINLLTNACKYGQGKPIHILVSEKSGMVQVSFRDHGIGIAEKDLARIFDRFERAVSGNNFSGLGLGLYIVTQLLNAHHGTIRVESEVGAGSMFTICVPVQIQAAKPLQFDGEVRA